MNREETIFEQALGIGSQQARDEFLRGACAGNVGCWMNDRYDESAPYESLFAK